MKDQLCLEEPNNMAYLVVIMMLLHIFVSFIYYMAKLKDFNWKYIVCEVEFELDIKKIVIFLTCL